MKLLKTWQLLLSVFALSACGGGGGSSPTSKTNQSPTVNISGPTQMESGGTISLSAVASDSDGSIASYSWATESGATITLGDSKSATLSVTATNVSVDTTVKLTLTVTDNQGASTQANVQIKIAAKKTSLAISGLVTDAVVPNANVTATVRDLTFTTTAGADGKYILNLSVDDAHLNDLVLITADGGLSKPSLKLVSQLPSMSTLLTQAGDDKQLDASENFSVNVTNVSTAEYALMARRWNLYGIPFASISNDFQLKNMAASVSDRSKYWLAALIKIVADMGGSLPAGAKTTLDVVMNSDLADELYSSISTSSPSLIEEVIASIKNDAALVRSYSSIYSGTYIVNSDNGNTDWVLTFKADKTGEAKSRFGTHSFSWSQNQHNLDIQFDEPFGLQQGDWKAISLQTFTYYESDGVVRSDLIVTKAVLNDAGEATYLSSDRESVSFVPTAKGLTLKKEDLAGEWVQGTDVAARLLKLNNDGSVSSSDLDGADVQAGLTWSLGSNGFTVFSNGKKLTDYYVLNDLSVGYSFVAISWLQSNPDGDSIKAWEGKLIKSQQLSLTKADLQGIYVGTAGRIYTLSNDDVIEGLSSRISPWNYSATDNSWTLNDYQDKSSVWLSYCDETANKSCKVSRKTVSKIFAGANGGYYILKNLTTYGPDGKQVSTQDWLETWTKIPSPSYFDYWFDRSAYRREFFQQTADGVKVWHFRSGAMEVNDRSDDRFVQASIPTTIERGKLRYTRNGVDKVLELISVSDEGIVVCEYNASASCAKGSEITLSNRTPAAISYKVSIGGSVEYDSEYASDSDPMTLFGNVAKFTIVPDQGYTVESVTGCGGKLEGFTYTTAPVKNKCTITANFVKASP